MIQPRRILIALTILLFVFVSVFGVSTAMNHEENGRMGGCPFMGEVTAICSMNAVEHLSAWIQSFLTIPIKSYVTVLLGILLVYLALNVNSIKEKLTQLFLTKRIILERQQYPQVFNHLRFLFSKGILHSRIYA